MAKYINKVIRTSIKQEAYLNETAGHFGFELKGSQDISQGKVKLDYTIDTNEKKCYCTSTIIPRIFRFRRTQKCVERRIRE
ncbi:hypothetical protein [Mycoplasma sp. HS2188]|uniref:hypothetical protein n=1 Tax=Mycoplasma sp. HS2188 TaxID=2976765 RepID=UPI0021AA9BE3|nr:hypothetical protein [Mycoplasma sp. HS2188]MCT4469586.1 hypothetical protein [Mycoplasma sp. HS2188]